MIVAASSDPQHPDMQLLPTRIDLRVPVGCEQSIVKLIPQTKQRLTDSIDFSEKFSKRLWNIVI